MSYFSTDRFLQEREDLVGEGIRLCPDCGGRGGEHHWTPGCKAPDPQSAEECPTCENQGVVDERLDYTDSHLVM